MLCLEDAILILNVMIGTDSWNEMTTGVGYRMSMLNLERRKTA